MKIKWLTLNELRTISTNNGMRNYLRNLLKGKEATPRSWLYEDEQPNDILDSWMSVLSSLETGTIQEKNVFQFDTSQLEKWGPQGEVKPISQLMDVVKEGFQLGETGRPQAFKSKEWVKAVQKVRRDLEALDLSLRPASYKHVVDDMRARDTLESNSGWPLFTRRNKPEVVKQAIAAATNGDWKTYPAIALFRNYNQKTRLVWMFPMAANLAEGAFLQPLQSAIIDHYSTGFNMTEALEMVSPWVGFEDVRLDITETYEDDSVTIAASDFSSTDAHFTVWHSLEVLKAIEVCFQPQYREQLRETVLNMHEIPLIIGPFRKITGLHGVSSGSNWTNFIETIFDIIFAEYVHNKIKEYPVHGLYAIGDDMSWWYEGYDDAFSKKLEQLGLEVGHIVKAEKTTNYPDRVKSLQRLFQRGYNTKFGETRGVYSTIRALKSSVYPEKFHKPETWSSDMFCARQFMILENCVDHPLFIEFVKFVCKGSPYLIPFAKKGRRKLDQIQREAKLIPGLNPTYNQEKRDQSLADFEAIRIASKL